MDLQTLVRTIMGLPLRLLPSGMTMPIMQGPLRGKRWIVGSQRHAFWLGIYEPHIQKLLTRDLKPASTFYDIGANVGFYSLLAAQSIRGGTVYAFEPLPANIGYLRRHLELNGIRNVTVLNVAISDEVRVASFKTEPTGAMGRLDPGGELPVQMTTIDFLLQSNQIEPPDYIKMDIEGAEFAGLLGARKCFEKFNPKLFLATHGSDVHANCRDLLRSWNYQIVVEKLFSERGEIVAVRHC
jgi:FkbM family methyltransferase